MKDWLRKVLGPSGLVLILIGSVTYGILHAIGPLAFLPLILGITLSFAALLFHVRAPRPEGSIRSVRRGASAGASAVFLAAILVFAQTLSSRHHIVHDATMNNRFSLAPQTMQVLKELDTDVRFTCFFKEATGEHTVVQDLLVNMRAVNAHIKFVFVDPDRDPVTARRYDVSTLGISVAESGGREYTFDAVSEQAVLNAVLRVTSDERTKICFSAGHGERSAGDTSNGGFSKIAESLRLQGYEVEEVFTNTTERLEDQCDVLVVAGPRSEFLQAELDRIDSFVDGGGKLLVLLDPITATDGLERMLGSWGLRAMRDVVVDRVGKALAGNFLTPIVNEYSDHPITKGFRIATFYPQARSVSIDRAPSPEATASIIASTGTSAYAETNTDTLLAGRTQFESEYDTAGPIAIAAAAEIGPVEERGHGRIVLFGDSDFMNNSYIDLSGNKDLLLNAFSWLAEDEDLIALRPRENIFQPTILTPTQGLFVFWVPFIGLPTLIAVIGILVVLHQRRTS